MFIGFGALLHIIEVLRYRGLEPDYKLDLIYTRELLLAYLYLFIIRLLVFLVYMFWSTKFINTLLIQVLCIYICLNSFNIPEIFKKHKKDWKNKQTLYDLKQKYYVKREN